MTIDRGSQATDYRPQTTEGGQPATAGETIPPAEPSRKRRRRGQVTIFPNWCKGCGLCAAFCPMKILEQNDEGRVTVTEPEKCTICRWCELRCPDFAIFVTEVEREE